MVIDYYISSPYNYYILFIEFSISPYEPKKNSSILLNFLNLLVQHFWNCRFPTINEIVDRNLTKKWRITNPWFLNFPLSGYFSIFSLFVFCSNWLIFVCSWEKSLLFAVNLNFYRSGKKNFFLFFTICIFMYENFE